MQRRESRIFCGTGAKRLPGVRAQAPAIVQYHLSGGVVENIGKWNVNLAYYHAFENSITGLSHSPTIAAIPGTSVTSAMHENSLTIGIARTF